MSPEVMSWDREISDWFRLVLSAAFRSLMDAVSWFPDTSDVVDPPIPVNLLRAGTALDRSDLSCIT